MMRAAIIASTVVLAATVALDAQRGQGRPGGPPPFGPQGPPPGRGRGGPGGPDGLAGMIVPAANPMTPAKIALGRQLFLDTSLSADRTIACATCHDPAHAYTDGRAVARGLHGASGTRNTPSLANAGFGDEWFWDGRATSLEAQALGPITSATEMGLAADQISARTGHSADEVTAALASYVRTIRTHDARIDWYRAGQTGMLTADEQAGFDLFRGRAQCGVCHGGPDFTDRRFHNTGVGWRDGTMADDGRFAVTHDDRDHGAFKTPSLRNVALTAPYMHDGSLATLEAVVDFYSDGGRRNPYLDPRVRPLRLSDQEKRQLVAFLRALNGPIREGLGGGQ